MTRCEEGQGRHSEGCRQATVACYRKTWPLFVLAALMLACGWWFR